MNDSENEGAPAPEAVATEAPATEQPQPEAAPAATPDTPVAETGTDAPAPEAARADALVTLQAPAGTDEANFGEERFTVSSEGTIEVPAAAVDPLVEKGGFVEVDAAPAPASGVVKMCHPEKIGCSFRGTEYKPDADGNVEVPQRAVVELEAHGFVVA